MDPVCQGSSPRWTALPHEGSHPPLPPPTHAHKYKLVALAATNTEHRRMATDASRREQARPEPNADTTT